MTRQNIVWPYRRSTWKSRCLPDFIIIGAQRSGTSSLFSYLRQHPQLIGSSRKEVHYFDGGLMPEIDDFARGQSWYRAHFPLRKDIGRDQKCFEATPLYLFNPLVPGRMHDLVPSAKLVAMLRDPVARAISHYYHELRKGHEPLSLEEALVAEEDRLKPVIAAGHYKSAGFIRHSYKSRGLYARQIKRFLELFPLRQIHVVSSEELFSETDWVLREMFQFLEVDADYVIPNLSPRNRAIDNNSSDDSVLDYLRSYFRPHNEELYELIGRRFAWS